MKKEIKNIEGKMMPQNIELEKSVLGCIISYPEAYDLVASMLKPEHFYSTENSLIYKAIQQVMLEFKAVDLMSLSVQLKKNGEFETIGGYYYIANLNNESSYFANIEAHSLIIIQKFLQRELIFFSNNLLQNAYSETIDCFDLIDKAGSEINNMLNVIESKKAKRLDQVAQEVLDDCFKAMTEDKPSGVPISIFNLQKQTNGWRNGNLIILAARPAMGKTAVGLDYAYHPSKLGIPVGFFSLEMTAKELAGRLMSKESSISSQKINNNTVNTYELTALRKDCLVFKELPLYIDDTPALSIQRLRSKAFRMKREYGIKLLVLDYLQLMDGAQEGDNREQEISKISRGLKKLAKELEIPIIALSQLSRQVESRPSKKPQLSDLRDSGAIEQDADMVIFLLRPEYYNQNTYLYGNEEMNTDGLMLHIIAKFRGGQVGELRNRWIAETTSIADWDRPASNDLIKKIENNYNFLND